jgi:prephenate dehydratase
MTRTATLPTTDTLTRPAASLRVVIQGVRGAFHEIAARHFFGQNVDIVPALSFPILFDKASDPAQADCAVLAIENNIAGSILGNYKLLAQHQLRIIGEVTLPIRQNLLVLPGVPIEEIREVHSHPMALAQCGEFFKRYPRIRLVESEDTAESAARISRKRLRHTAAIASTLAAELYELEVLAPGIEDNPHNYTRFLAVESLDRPVVVPVSPYAIHVKCAVSFATVHAPGALSQVLTVLAVSGANLTKIQSMPIEGRMWEYQFFVDFTHPDATVLTAVLDELKARTHDFKLFGMWPVTPDTSVAHTDTTTTTALVV